MCGIVGCAGDLTIGHEKLVRTLLILDSIRGEDSTGVAVIGKWQGNVKIAKQVGDPFQLFDHKSFDNVFTGMQKAIIGHNRYATTGGVSRHNAHPFENPSVVGVHNGTLRSKHLLVDAKNFVVDSENIYHHIDKHGLKDALHYMEGAWALVWWDKEHHTINFLRNKERPLFMAWSKDAKQMFWASEPWMLEAAFMKHQIDAQEIFLFERDVHMSIHIDEKGIMSKPVIRNAPSTYKPPVYVQPVHNVPVNVKKEEPTPVETKKLGLQVVAPSCETQYLSLKGRSIETLSVGTDEYGGKYVSCFDPDRQYYEIRLYAKPKDPIWDLIGCDIIANPSGWSSIGSTPGKGYYKLSPHDFKICPPKEEEEEESILGPTGKKITKSEFEKEYQQCEWCTSPLEFGGNNRFTTSGQCVCHSCSKDPQVLEYVNLQ